MHGSGHIPDRNGPFGRWLLAAHKTINRLNFECVDIDCNQSRSVSLSRDFEFSFLWGKSRIKTTDQCKECIDQ